MRLATEFGTAKNSIPAVRTEPIIPPTMAAMIDPPRWFMSGAATHQCALRVFLAAFAGSQQHSVFALPVLLLVPHLGLHRTNDVLRAKTSGRAGADARHGRAGTDDGEPGIAFKAVAFGAGERRARLVALAIVDDAELVPGERILVVAADRGLQHLLGL